jgi:hypothetical protein
LDKDRFQASAMSGLNSPGSDLVLFDGYLCLFKVGRKGFVRGRDHAHRHICQVKRVTVGSAQLRCGFYYIVIRADDLEMIAQVREGSLQNDAHSKSGFRVDGLGEWAAELKIVCEQGVGILEIGLLNGIRQGSYNVSLVHIILLYY